MHLPLCPPPFWTALRRQGTTAFLGEYSMKLTTFALAAVLLAAPALAQDAAPPSDTIKAVVEKGLSMGVAGQAGEIVYKPDGTFSGFEGQIEDKYRTDGNKLCITLEAFGMIDQRTNTRTARRLAVHSKSPRIRTRWK